MKDVLDGLADRVMELDSQALQDMLPQIQADMEQADDHEQWSRAVITFFLVNAVRFKGSLERRRFNEPSPLPQSPPRLRVVK